MANSIQYSEVGWIQLNKIFNEFDIIEIVQGYGKTIPYLLVPHPLLCSPLLDSQIASTGWSSEIFPSRL